MKPGSFDDFARTLAEPMPRRRALAHRRRGAPRIDAARPAPGGRMGGRVRAGHSLHRRLHRRRRHRRLRSREPERLRADQVCADGLPPAGEKCCPRSDQPWICNEDDQCGSPNGPHCISCPEERKCGKACCKSDEFCASPNRELCCKRGENSCLVPNSPHGACCRPGTQCCFTENGGVCCGSGQRCRNGKCVCKEGETCGERCCKKGETCSNGKCCPKGKVNCGDGECCKNAASCCGENCCTGARETCVGGAKGKQCCLRSRISGSGASARCCPGGTVATASGCCPPTNLNCCDSFDPGGLACLGPHDVCVRGACKTL